MAALPVFGFPASGFVPPWRDYDEQVGFQSLGRRVLAELRYVWLQMIPGLSVSDENVELGAKLTWVIQTGGG